jgi:hypothetical protein
MVPAIIGDGAYSYGCSRPGDNMPSLPPVELPADKA